MSDAVKDLIVFVGLGMLLGIAWFKFYVAPYDQALTDIRICMIEMGNVHSREFYDVCAEKIKGEK